MPGGCHLKELHYITKNHFWRKIAFPLTYLYYFPYFVSDCSLLFLIRVIIMWPPTHIEITVNFPYSEFFMCVCCVHTHMYMINNIYIYIKLPVYTYKHLPWSLENSVSSVQFSHSFISDSLRSHESQHSRPPCPSYFYK